MKPKKKNKSKGLKSCYKACALVEDIQMIITAGLML